MNTDFLPIVAATPAERRGLFLTTANRLGTTLQNIEKDFWVCLVLDLLFNDRDATEPRLLFKGGTSLSKGYGLISRFSEDLDITVFREDIGQNIDASNMAQLSGKQQRVRLTAIKNSCQEYIMGQLKNRLNQSMQKMFCQANVKFIDLPVILDPNDREQQTLLVNYPTVNIEMSEYIKPAVKIEAGAKSALEPHQSIAIQPYVMKDILAGSLNVPNIVTITPERTFW